MKTVSLLLFCLLAGSCLSVPTQRSGEKEFKQADLSDAEHYQDGEHDARYDHEAFLGDENKKFDDLPPEEAKERLGLIVVKIDKNQDGDVSKEELADWIKHVSRRYIYEDADNQWPSHNTDEDEFISWEEWYRVTYGHMADVDKLDSIYDTRRKMTYQDMAERDKKRFNAADENGDGQLSRDEYAIFLHPEDSQHMRQVVIEETLQDMDRDKDGFVDKEEYINDLWQQTEDGPQGEPLWVNQEKTHFTEHRDKNDDGRLDKEEIGEWILPTGYDYIEAEVSHLMQSADDDRDGKLTKEEILDHYDTFVGSQATEFGEALYKHDEF